MITFDIEKMRSVYVFVTKITSDYIYVTSHRNGEAFAIHDSVACTHNERPCNKVRISKSVSHGYFKYNVMKEFGVPRLVSLNYYGQDIVSIEIQMYNHRLGGFQEAANWQSNFSKCIPLLRAEIESTVSDGKIFINGYEVFWPYEKPDAFNDAQITPDGCFRSRRVRSVSLAKMGMAAMQTLNVKKELEAANAGHVEVLDDIDTKTNLKVSEGSVLAYHPLGCDTPENAAMVVYSPVLQRDDSAKSKAKTRRASGSSDAPPKSKKDELRAVYRLASSSDQAFPNLIFAMKAATTIGRLYGHKETEFLDIPGLIVKTGEVNFYNIDDDSLKSTPIDRTAVECLAWIFRFIHRETCLDNMRQLTHMFRYCLKRGLVFASSIDIAYRVDAPKSDIPLLSLAQHFGGITPDVALMNRLMESDTTGKLAAAM